MYIERSSFSIQKHKTERICDMGVTYGRLQTKQRNDVARLTARWRPTAFGPTFSRRQSDVTHFRIQLPAAAATTA